MFHTQEKIQKAINEEAKKNTSKTVKNHHGLLSAALAEYFPNFTIRTKLPQKVKADIRIPDEMSLNLMLQHCAGSVLETAILFGATLGLRRSELCALTWGDINFEANTVRVNKALVLTDEKKWVMKGTKTYSGTRTLKMSNRLRSHLLILLTNNNTCKMAKK